MRDANSNDACTTVEAPGFQPGEKDEKQMRL